MSRTLKYLIVEDNELDQLTIRMYAGRHPNMEHAGTAATSYDGIDLIRQVKPDVLFCDVEMPGTNGIEVLRATRGLVPVNVLITSHPEFALDGFELQVLDFILKPVTEERFAHTARRIAEYMEMRDKAGAFTGEREPEYLVIKDGHTRVRIPVPDILYLEAMNNYTKIVTAGKRHLVLATLSSFMDALPQERFLRVHRSYVVARDKVTKVQGAELHFGAVHVPVGRTYRQAVAEWEL